jgi:hypothetical protein
VSRLAPVLAVLVALTAAGPASAAELTFFGGELEYRAVPGEANALTVSTQAGAMVFRDTGAVVTLSVPLICASSDPHTVVCQLNAIPGFPTMVSALLGDGDDSGVAVANPVPVVLHGEDGNDRLTVGEPVTGLDAPVEAHGDAGNDLLSGAAGREFLRGGPGADILAGGDSGDLLDGGPDDDALYGGADQDRLAGGPGDDQLFGDAGDDRLAGQDGDDVVTAADADVANGGKGNDTILAGGRAAATLGCSGGRDLVAPSAGDRVARSCEKLQRSATCRPGGTRCRVEATLTTRSGRVLAAATKRIRPGATAGVTLALTRPTRREIVRRRHLDAVFRMRALEGMLTGRRRTDLTLRSREPIP